MVSGVWDGYYRLFRQRESSFYALNNGQEAAISGAYERAENVTRFLCRLLKNRY